MSKKSDDDFCCGCCLGLAVGYMLWGGTGCEAIQPPEYDSNANDNKSITETVSEKEPDNFLLRQIDRYQREVSPKIKKKFGKDKLCKFEPSCSEYARQAIKEHGSVAGIVMATARLARCNPSSKGGEDPVGTPWYAKKIF